MKQAVTVSKHFRKLLSDEFPGLGNNQDYWNLLGYLLINPTYESGIDLIRLSSKRLAGLVGKDHLLQHGNFNAQEYLRHFSKDVIQLDIQGWSYLTGRARTIIEPDWPKQVTKALKQELQGKWLSTGRVYLHDGKAFTKTKQLVYRNEQQKDALKHAQTAQTPEVEAMLDYLNKLPYSIFLDSLCHHQPAVNSVKNLAKDKKKNYSLLRSYLDQPQPFYRPSERSLRITPYGSNFLMLKGKLRKIISQDWLECDLKACQFSVASKIWDLPDLHAFLSSGGDVWQLIFNHLQIPASSKGEVKKAVYSIMFGNTKGNITKILKPYNIKANQLLQVPYLQDLWNARNHELAMIESQGFAIDCFNRKIFLDDNKGITARSVLAQTLQAWEIKLLWPVIELAIQQRSSPRGFYISIWQHDGFALKAKRAQDTTKWSKAIQHLTNKHAELVGIPTKLEVINLPKVT